MKNVKQVKYNLHYVSMHMFFIRNDQATQFTEDSKSVLLCLYFVLVVLSTSTVVTRTWDLYILTVDISLSILILKYIYKKKEEEKK